MPSTVALNCVEKCIQKPSRVPGCSQDAARLVRISASASDGPRSVRVPGASWTTASSATTMTMPSDAASR
jgi:hypothetical protein